MISCKLCGGLGNQLFQIFTTIAYSIDNLKPFFFLNNYQLGNGKNGITIRHTYWTTLFITLQPFLKNINNIPPIIKLNEKEFKYNELPIYFKKNYATLLVGYFQSPKYFDKYKMIIYKILKIDYQKTILKDKIKIDLNDSYTISMHFRYGDYKKYPDIYRILDYKYYNDALSYILTHITTLDIKKKIIILYFCEDESLSEAEEIINIIKQQNNYSFIEFKRADNKLEDWEQMLLMSLCNYNIIANSTFSWWGAYLNTNSNIVCCPSKWFMPETNKDTTDLLLENWILF